MQRDITYMFVVLIFDALVHKNIYNPQRSWEIGMDYVYIKLCSDWGNIATCPAYLFHATDTVPKSTVTVAGPRQHWTTDNLPEWYFYVIWKGSDTVCLCLFMYISGNWYVDLGIWFCKTSHAPSVLVGNTPIQLWFLVLIYKTDFVLEHILEIVW